MLRSSRSRQEARKCWRVQVKLLALITLAHQARPAWAQDSDPSGQPLNQAVIFDDRAAGRPQENGPLMFHEGTEEELLQTVRQAMRAAAATSAEDDPAKVVLDAVDDFCWHRHWMMNIGDMKGHFLDEALRDQFARTGTPLDKKFRAMEFGSYIGYSAIRIARLLPAGALLYSVDTNPSTQRIAQQLAELADVQDSVEFLAETAEEATHMLWLRDIPLDFVLLDHDKQDYYLAIQRLEKSGLLLPGATIVADNVGAFDVNEYLTHVRQSGLYRSRYVNTSLEYTPLGPDGRPSIADGLEISIYEPGAAHWPGAGVGGARFSGGGASGTEPPSPRGNVPVLPSGKEERAEPAAGFHLPEKALLLFATAGGVFAVYHLLSSGSGAALEADEARVVRQPLQRNPREDEDEDEEVARDAAE